MNDDVKVALDELGRRAIPADEAARARELILWVRGEPARQAAAVAKRPFIDGPLILQGEHEADIGQVGVTLEECARLCAAKAEEVREACARWMEGPEPTMMDRANGDSLRSTPLTATPLKDENKALREDLEHERKTNARLLAERDEARAERDEWKRKAQVDKWGLASKLWSECYADLSETNQKHMRERDAALAKVKELEALVGVCSAHQQVVMECRLCNPALREVDALRAQLAEATDDGTLSARIGEVRRALGMSDLDSAAEVSAVESLKAQLDEAVEVLRKTTEALEGSFPGDESVGLPEFPEVPLAEAWKRRIIARAFLAKHPEGT
jgi:hypothetical protein